jgi:hypothetical protein
MNEFADIYKTRPSSDFWAAKIFYFIINIKFTPEKAPCRIVDQWPTLGLLAYKNKSIFFSDKLKIYS